MTTQFYNWRRLLTLLMLPFAVSCLAGSDDVAWQAISTANERFAVRLSTSVGLSQPRSNVAVSPLLLQTALTLLYEGTVPGSPTAQDMRKALQLQSFGAASAYAVHSFQQFMAHLKQATAVGCNLRLLSEFYAQLRYTFNYREKFQTEAARMGVGTQRLDFNKVSSAADHINNEFLTRTNYSVGEAVSPTLLLASGETPFVHISAVTFRSPWAYAFDKQQTQRLAFFSDEHNHKMVDTMFIQHRCKYVELSQLDARLIELPFEQENLSFLIIYPNQVSGLVDLERKLQSGFNLNKLRHQLSMRKVALSLPKFTLSTHSNLRQIFLELGLNKLFTSDAQLNNAFSALFPVSVPHLTAVAHSVLLEVQESGGNAAEEFSFGDLFRRAVPLVINHPFYFAICYDDIILLAGHIVDI